MSLRRFTTNSNVGYPIPGLGLWTFLLTISISLNAFGQPNGSTRIELLNADVSEFNEQQNPGATKLLGNVHFRHESADMYCDSAYLYRDENRLDAFGRIRITQGDSLTLTGGQLAYDGATRVARVFRQVVLTDRKMTMNTSQVFYDLGKSSASFQDSAHIVDGQNVLTSKTGYFESATKDLYFKKDVVLVNPQYTLTCDTLRYNTRSRITYFLGPTHVHTEDSHMYCESGWYDSERQRSLFNGNAALYSRQQTLRGDTITYDQEKNIGKAFGHVSLFDSTRSLIIRGGFAEHHERSDSTWVTQRAEMIQFDERDSLFLHADTLLAVGNHEGKDTSGQQDVFAYHHVRIYKSDLQGVCDSLVYTRSDSAIRFYRSPILWSGFNQLTADSITLRMSGNALDKIYLNVNSLIISQSDTLQEGVIDSLRFNQIGGRKMTGYFVNNALDRIHVIGNVQTIYYAKDKNDRDAATNRADGSELMILLSGNELKQISFINDPDGTLYPLEDIPIRDLRLKGFQWLQSRRPKDRDSIFN